MSTFDANFVTSELRWEEVGHRVEAEIRTEFARRIIGGDHIAVEGSLTVIGVELRPGQKIKATFTIIDEGE